MCVLVNFLFDFALSRCFVAARVECRAKFHFFHTSNHKTMHVHQMRFWQGRRQRLAAEAKKPKHKHKQYKNQSPQSIIQWFSAFVALLSELAVEVVSFWLTGQGLAQPALWLESKLETGMRIRIGFGFGLGRGNGTGTKGLCHRSGQKQQSNCSQAIPRNAIPTAAPTYYYCHCRSYWYLVSGAAGLTRAGRDGLETTGISK